MTHHAIARARERYGLSITFDDINAMIADIQAGRTVLLARRSDLEHHLVLCQGVAVVAAFDPDRGWIRTLLHRRARNYDVAKPAPTGEPADGRSA